MNQSELNVFVNIQQGKRDQLESVLRAYQLEWRANKVMPFEALKTIHFCRWAVIPTLVTDQGEIPERLTFESNFDGDSKEVHITQLCNIAPEMVDSIYQYCENYPEGEALTPQSRAAFLIQNIHPSRVFFAGAPLRSLDRILRENKLRLALRECLNSNDYSNLSAGDVVVNLQKQIRNNAEFEWAQTKEKVPGTNYFKLFLFGLVMLPLIPFLLLLMVLLRIFCERKEVPLGLEPGEVGLDHMKLLEQNEDYTFQNQFTQLLKLKPGLLRRITLNFVLTATEYLGKNLFDKGQLMGIPTIHFARWIILDDKKHMLFLSNFDGSWQQYLGDFIDKSGWGLTGIYSATEGFPKSYFLFFGGAYNEEQFLAWSRYYQIPTQFWFSAYPNLSIKNVINNSIIAHDLFSNLGEEKAQQFLNRI